MHNPREHLKIEQDRAALQEAVPPCQPPQYPRRISHDIAVQDHAVLPQKLPKSRIIESLYIAEVRGLQTRVDVQKMYIYRREVLEYLDLKVSKKGNPDMTSVFSTRQELEDQYRYLRH